MMKQFFLLLLSFSLPLLAAHAGGNAAAPKDGVEVIYFHGKQRCATCICIEKYAREVVEKQFAAQVKSGQVRYREVDISTPEGEKWARAYRVTWSSLYVTRWKQGKEKRHDLTQFAFKHARKRPDEFKKGLARKIIDNLK